MACGAWPAGRRPDPAVLGLTLVVLALAAEALTQTGLLGPDAALAVVVGGWAVGGLGIGLAYPQLSSRAFDDLPPGRSHRSPRRSRSPRRRRW